VTAAGRGRRALLVALAALAGCETQTRTELRGHVVRRTALAALRLGETTADQIEARIGPPDERGSDGALTYRWEQVARTERRVAGLVLGGTEAIERHAVTFRFERGALSRICQSRS
jgi:outer membrane protein assembly factor BamE (lipoprotein component of BamABCDE complex)